MMLIHRHKPSECEIAFAAWRGFESPLRRRPATASCRSSDSAGDHVVVWEVDSPDREAALALLPTYVADRTEVREAGEVSIP